MESGRMGGLSVPVTAGTQFPITGFHVIQPWFDGEQVYGCVGIIIGNGNGERYGDGI